MKIQNRVTEMTGTDYPIIQAPMGWIARRQLASAVCNAGGLGIIETSSGETDACKAETEAMADLPTAPFGRKPPIPRLRARRRVSRAAASRGPGGSSRSRRGRPRPGRPRARFWQQGPDR